MIILNFFNINDCPEIEYYKASLIIRDIIQELFSEVVLNQKKEILDEKFQKFEYYEDVYDEYMKNMKQVPIILNKYQIFLNFDKDFDHLHSRTEFDNFIRWLIPYSENGVRDLIFIFSDDNKDKKVSYTEFKGHFPDLMKMTRIKNVMREISQII